MRRLIGAALFILTAGLAPSGQSNADPAIDLMGNWIVRPFTWKTPPLLKGCLYRQWVTVEKRVRPGVYIGRSRQQTECKGLAPLRSRNVLRITVTGRTVTISSADPQWQTETLTYVSPLLMKGADTTGHTMIYERPKAPPSS
jgi:hypothetical protein